MSLKTRNSAISVKNAEHQKQQEAVSGWFLSVKRGEENGGETCSAFSPFRGI